MKQKLYLALVVLLLLGGLALSQWQSVEAPASPMALLYWFGDSERELTRIPMAYTRIPDAQEIAAGQQMARLARLYAARLSTPATPEDTAIENYAWRVGAQLAAHAKRKLPYEFHYVPNMDLINAFALPGGQVFIGAGLIARMETEDELANVLGHEIEHVDHYHCGERLQWELALRKLPLGSALAIPAFVFQAGYTKEQEFEADREGTALALAAGYSPRGAVRMFEEFDRLRGAVTERPPTPQQEISQVARDILRGYFQSHPPPNDRIEQIKRIYGRELESTAPMRPLEFAYVYVRIRAAGRLAQAQQESRRKRAEELYREAAELALRSLQLKANEPLALRILAFAQLGLNNYGAATAAYRQLVPQDPEGADEIRKFGDELAARALGAKEYKNAAGLAEFSLGLQPNQPPALRTLALAQVGLGELAAAEQTSRKIGKLYPGAGRELAGELAKQASLASRDARLSDAVRLLSLAVELFPNTAMRRELGDARFDAGDFAGAAGGYRSLLTERGAPAELILRYAEALGAQGRAVAAAAEFQAWAASVRYPDAAWVAITRVESAGLSLLAGNGSQAETVIAQATSAQPGIAPEQLGRLSWWYRKANRGKRALEFLRRAVEIRPGNAELQTALAWAEWEANQPEQGLERFARTPSGQEAGEQLGDTPQMGRALAEWLLGQSDAALENFAAASEGFPTWLNLAWVRAVFSARTAEVVAEVHSAREAAAQFNRADFSAASARYRALLEKHSGDAGLFRRYADALSGMGQPQKSVGEYQAFLERIKPASSEVAQQVQLDLAGLKLLAGDASAAKAVVQAATRPGAQRLDARSLVRIAWWCFRTGSTPAAVENQLRAAQQRAETGQAPEITLIANAVAWLELERNNPRRAYEAFLRAGADDPRLPPAFNPAVGSTIALWRMGPTERKRAQEAFERIAKDLPQWLEARWVEALCPAHVVGPVRELQAAERARRKDAEQRAAMKR